MQGEFKEYNWRDIERLIYADAGLTEEADCRTKGELWFVGGFNPPVHERDTCVRVNVYNKTFSERIEDHAADKLKGGES